MRNMNAPSLLDSIGRTPLATLPRIGAGLPVPLLAKCEHLNPGGSVKDRIALAIVDEAERSGRIAPGATLIEATAGNTGMGLALVAAARGYSLVCVMPEKMSVDKRVALRALGARVIVTPNAPLDDPRNFQNVARGLAAERGWYLTDQFANPANPLAHERSTGPEILGQAGGPISAFVAGAGTGGTLTGVARCFERSSPRTRMVLADPAGSVLAEMVRSGRPGVDGAYQVEGIGSSRVPPNLELARVHRAEVVIDDESFAMTRRLWSEEGLLVGGSSGTAVVAALRVARESNPGDGAVVVLLPDSWDRYRSKEWAQPAGPD
ncbi:MAG: cysteine synthase family protein [Candidatus Eisenbacteria bacterium]|nr:cysteine synthase family protein [Candidatus Eisenbacteria bacterium]